MQRPLPILALVVAVTSACGGGDASAPDASTGIDAGASADAATSTDAATSDAARRDAASPDAASPDAASPDAASPDAASPDAASPDAASADAASPDAAGPDAGRGALIAECQARATLMAANCASFGSESRRCRWDAYRELCVTGQTQLLLDSMECLSSDICRTFSDPNDGLACLNTTHAAGQSAAARALIADWCESCGWASAAVCSTTVFGAFDLVPYLADAEIALLDACRGTACTLDELIDACGTSVPSLAAFATCP